MENERGMTLTELLIGSSLSMVTLLIAVMVLSQAANFQILLIEKLTNEESTNRIIYTLRNYVAGALQLTDNSPNPISPTMSNHIGQIAEYNLNSWTPSNGAGAIVPLAFFRYEGLKSGTAQNAMAFAQRFPIIGIFFQAPTTNKYGVLYIAKRFVDEAANTRLFAEDGDEKMGQIVDLKITAINSEPFQGFGLDSYDNDLLGRQMVSSLTISITTRAYTFGSTDSTVETTWCPPQFMPNGANANAACQTSQTYRDTTKTVAIKVRNNTLGRSLSQRMFLPYWTAETTHQHSKVVGPYRRPFETTYFLSPNISAEASDRSDN